MAALSATLKKAGALQYEIWVKMLPGSPFTQWAFPRLFGSAEVSVRLSPLKPIQSATIAFAGTTLMASLLFGVKPKDPLTFCAVAGLLTIVALASCFGPAYAASRVDPMRVLQDE